MRIFFLGGTFDPPHLGHLSIAKRCLGNEHCDFFIFVPSKQNPLKQKPYFSSSDRISMLDMLRNCLDRKELLDKVAIDLFEVKSEAKVNYSIDTINYLMKKYEPSSLYMVIGQDLLKDIKKWKDWDKIKEMVKIVCVHRPGYDHDTDIDITIKINDLSKDIDSTSIRNKIKMKSLNSLEKIMPSQLIDYINRGQSRC
tara:strand:- start:1301 stop:1891 length:591 start_codon:yes stop_codon:yes gene_type:complete